MIDTAERLIAERGLGALSLREVAADAGQRNHSAVQYHFGSRAGLVEAVFDARMRPIDARRAELLAQLEEAGDTTDLAALTEVVVRPMAEAIVVEPPGWYGRFLAEIARSEPSLLLTDRPAMVTLHRAARLMIAAMVAVPVSLRAERSRMALGAAVTMLADRERQLWESEVAGSEPQASPPAGPSFVSHVIDLVQAMVSVPPSPALAAELAATALPD